jgi:hypothetical protein
VASFQSSSKIFSPSAEPEGEMTYYSRLLDPDASYEGSAD